ncbi:hypothetical protein AVEN_102399-1 [Araneus ventricosus]|uniref:Uncharacterized protein n=1 Tax=Araneus ventricosus TaxID=182803 RepID=A0A4Y2TDT9_ARAVE|nr:hypothetical protein AVEN_102399-1 [Araneus ventricosus]
MCIDLIFISCFSISSCLFYFFLSLIFSCPFISSYPSFWSFLSSLGFSHLGCKRGRSLSAILSEDSVAPTYIHPSCHGAVKGPSLGWRGAQRKVRNTRMGGGKEGQSVNTQKTRYIKGSHEPVNWPKDNNYGAVSRPKCILMTGTTVSNN